MFRQICILISAFLAVDAINIGNSNTNNNLGFPPGTVPTEAILRSTNWLSIPSDVTGTWLQTVPNVIDRHLRDGKVACDNIVDELNAQDTATSTSFQCRWSCAKGSFVLSVAYQPGSLYTWQNLQGDLTLPKSVMVWREACQPPTFAPSISTVVIPAQNSFVIPPNPNTGVATTGLKCNWKRTDNRAWQGADATTDSATDMASAQQTYARSKMAEALNTYNTALKWTQYVQRAMETKFPRARGESSWQVYAGCGDTLVWSMSGKYQLATRLTAWLGDVRFVILRPAEF